jgi:hypothetical protein
VRDRQGNNAGCAIVISIGYDHGAWAILDAFFLSFQIFTTPKIGITDNEAGLRIRPVYGR